MNIREYQEKDRPALLEMIAILQDYEAVMQPGMLPGSEMAEKMLVHTLSECKEKDGKIYLADVDDKVVGFVYFFVLKEETDLMYYDPEITSVYVSDYLVLEEYRGKGIGRALMEKVEEYAKELGIKKIKLTVLAKNSLARETYKKLGYLDEEITLSKEIKDAN